MSYWNKILCPTDFSEPSYVALKEAHQLATAFGAELCVLHVMEEMHPVLGLVSDDEFDTMCRDQAALRIHHVVREQLGEEARARAIVKGGVAASKIVEAAAEEKPDVIVIATHGLTGWRHLVFGSVAESVARLAHCPVLIVHQQSELERGETKLEPKSGAGPERNDDLTPVAPSNDDAHSTHRAQWKSTDPRQISEAQFPTLGGNCDKLRFLLNYAVLAPSTHNSQPWRWSFDGDCLELYPDYTRLLPSSDPFSRELIISCGAALFNLRTAIRHFGYLDEVETFPDLRRPDLLARVSLGQRHEPTDDEHLLFAAIPVRQTYRFPFQPCSLPEIILDKLKAAAREHAGMLRFVDPEVVTGLIECGNEIRNEDRSFLRELRQWTLFRQSSGERRDGIPFEALGNSGMACQVSPGQNHQTIEADQALLSSASAIAVLESETDTPHGWLAVGQALEHVLLLARVNGIYASYFNQPAQVRELWAQLRREIGPEQGLSYYPQLVFRLGRIEPATEILPTPRRAVEEVLDEDPSTNPALTEFISTYR